MPDTKPTPTPAPAEDARWLSPEERKLLVENGCTEDPDTCKCRLAYFYRHAQLMDERQQQTWLAFTAERDLHNAAKKEIAAKDREIAELRRDRERLNWLESLTAPSISQYGNGMWQICNAGIRSTGNFIREAIDAAMGETNAD